MKQARIWAALGVVLVAVVVVLRVFWWSPERAAGHRALQGRGIATRALAEYVSKAAPGEEVVVLSNPFAGRSGQSAQVRDFEEAGLGGLKQAWEERKQPFSVEMPALNPMVEKNQNPGALVTDPNTTTPMSYLQANRAWDTVLKKHPGAGVFVSLIGFPVDTLESEYWKRPKPRLAMLLPDMRFIGGTDGMLAAFGSGKLIAVVLRKPGAPAESAPVSGDATAEFERRYLLVTRESVATLLRDYPQAFRQ